MKALLFFFFKFSQQFGSSAGRNRICFFFAGSGSVVSNIPLKVDLRCSHVQSVEEPVSVFCF